MPRLEEIIKPSLVNRLKSKNAIPNFLPKLDKNKQYQEEIWADKTYKVDPKSHLFTTIQERFGNRIINNVKLPSNSVVVDIGCFIGEKLWQLDRRSDYLGIGVDIAIPSLTAAKDIDIFGHQFIAADLENLPFKDNSVDFVMVFDVIEHLTQPARGFDEISRILKPGGLFLLHIPIKNNFLSAFWWKQKLFPAAARRDYLDVGHAPDRMLTTHEIASHLSRNHLKIEREVYYNAFLVHIFDRELATVTGWIFKKIYGRSKSDATTRSVHTGSAGRMRTIYARLVVPVLELVSYLDFFISKLKIGNTYFVMSRKV